jgi:hypothetical protein
MATGFYLTPGYAYSEANSATAESIMDIARTIPLDRLRAKCVEYGLENAVDETGSTLDDYVAAYKELPSKDLTVYFSHEKDAVCMMASGGRRSREIKEMVRRAFSILVLDACFKRGLAVNLNIA